MSIKKQYLFEIVDRRSNNGDTFPDYTSHTYKSFRKAEEASFAFEAIPGPHGGTARIIIRRVR